MREINRILCPVDLSEISQQAVAHAVLFARWYDAKITALHVCNPIVIPSADFAAVAAGSSPVLTEPEIAELKRQLLAYFGGRTSADIDALIANGYPARQILECARSLRADLIVIGTHGAGGFEHLLLGSVTEKVLRKATCPVLTVPPHPRTTSNLPFKRLLCPVDFSDSSLAALDFAFSLAQQGDAELTILHVFEWRPDDEPLTNRPISVPEFRPQLEHELTVKLRGLIPDSVRDWCRPTIRIGHGKAYREILGVAIEDSADLIVMGVHGRNALDVMLFGSTTNQVVRRATCPVLTLRH